MTQLISQRFYQFFHLFPIYPHLPKVLAMCPEGEHHQIGLLLYSLFMRKNGAEVLYLGANTPEEGIFPIIREQCREHTLSVMGYARGFSGLAIVDRT
ncbi:hypothetical protein [Paenibacillus pabuli]|uniref:hypothetical protein n=1 Tax=Paenibacillus pabuli TaxID=1472 RepID=UPI003CF6016C